MQRLLRSLARLGPAIVAVLAALAIPFWILGVPGVSGTAYARGWSLGLTSLLVYLGAYAVLLVLRGVLRLGGIGLPRRSLDVAAWLAVALLGAMQIRAWSLILAS